MRALLLVAVLLLAGCASEPDARASLVPYPRYGDVATYDVTGALVEFARWENGIPFAATAQVRFSLSTAPDALDGARAVHNAYLVRMDVAEAGVFDERSERYVSPTHGALVQAYYPLSQDQGIVSFDERGFPWLFGASALFGEELEGDISIGLPDNLGRGQSFAPAWRVVGEEDGLTRLDLVGAPGMSGSLWMDGSAWPARAQLRIASPDLAPHVRSDGGYPVEMSATRASLVEGDDPVPPRDRGATFADDQLVPREPWDGEKPPDGAPTPLLYPLADAVSDAKLLDVSLQQWLGAADAPILYRGTYQEEPGPVEGSTSALWLLQWVDRADTYYEVQIARLVAPPTPAGPLPAGVPRVESSAPAQAPADENHGWFDPATAPEELVPLAEGIRIVQETFGAQEVQVFLRSFTDPAGYSYFLDGGFEGPGRYTVVYNPATGFIEEATGPVTPRFAG